MRDLVSKTLLQVIKGYHGLHQCLSTRAALAPQLRGGTRVCHWQYARRLWSDTRRLHLLLDDCCKLVLPYHAVQYATVRNRSLGNDSPRMGAESTTTIKHPSTTPDGKARCPVDIVSCLCGGLVHAKINPQLAIDWLTAISIWTSYLINLASRTFCSNPPWPTAEQARNFLHDRRLHFTCGVYTIGSHPIWLCLIL